MVKLQLTPHFSLAELTVTNTKLDNTPSKEVVEVLRTTAFYMEKVRDLLGEAIKVNSGYRSPDVNRAVGGSANSSHLYGYAVDFVTNNLTPLEVATAIAKSSLKFDQLIYEKTWVHISFDPRMRGNILTLKGKGKYVKGIV